MGNYKEFVEYNKNQKENNEKQCIHFSRVFRGQIDYTSLAQKFKFSPSFGETIPSNQTQTEQRKG